MTPRGRPPAVTREAIAEAVLAIGFQHLTFAAVRESLGISEMTLFRHVKDRDGLVRIALDRVIDRVEWPPLDRPWPVVLEQYAFVAWHAFEAHPGSATEIARGVVPVGVLRMSDDLCATLTRQGFTTTNAVLACDAVFDLVTDQRRGVEHIDHLTDDNGPSRAHLRALWTGPIPAAPSPHSATPAEQETIHAAMRDAITADPLVWFTRKLHIVLAGITHTLAP